MAQANVLGVSKSALGRYLHGKPVSATNLHLMVAAADARDLWRPGEREEFLAAFLGAPVDQSGPADADQHVRGAVSLPDDPDLDGPGELAEHGRDQTVPGVNRRHETSDVTSDVTRRVQRTRVGARWTVLAGVATIIAASALGGIFGSRHAARSTPETAPTAGCRPNRYEVEQAADVLDEDGDLVGRSIPGDTFFREIPEEHAPRRYRYYGTIPSRHLSGYVMQAKLKPSCA
ncbi:MULTISPECIES: hypothetical protein [Actinomadura]|uniref:Uncharacterized protein n=1 Tax=Actinomadura litoris TaxID=2678616 RepID=A0A7K1KU31_9ACTN|nr:MULTISPECIES: hypothetical protein [Actinomadura]MBT2207489.1 hypothetical protein [Actinomadura sp. NEAU-AAG7]MUN35700.1 hypothetical protein [Actinomadura litoris]